MDTNVEGPAAPAVIATVKIHRPECPANPNYLARSRPGTLCYCFELDKADRDAMLEDLTEDTIRDEALSGGV